MALSIQSLKEAPVIELEIIDSTNNYAMRLIDADTAQEGLTIVAREQTRGKGQRGRQWQSVPGQNLMMSLIVAPHLPLEQQFIFNAIVAVAVADVIQSLDERWNVAIKWPNDIIVNDKKTGGLLIENVLRGNKWSYSIIGLGLNVLQADFPPSLPHAASLFTFFGIQYPVSLLMHRIREQLLHALYAQQTDPEAVLRSYNEYLYCRHTRQLFTDGITEWEAMIIGVMPDGTLQVQPDTGSPVNYSHGTVRWLNRYGS